MSKSFLCRRSAEGSAAMKNAIEQIRRELHQAEKNYGPKSREAAELLLILGALNYVAEDYARAEALVVRYVAIATEKTATNPADTFWGLTLLSDIYGDLNRFADCLRVSALSERILGQPDLSAVDTLTEVLLTRAFASRDKNTMEGHRQGFIFALVALSWCLSHGLHRCTSGATVLNRLCSFFESYGIGNEHWEWVVKHAHLRKYDFVGLLSTLLHYTGLASDWMERMVRQEPRVIEVR